MADALLDTRVLAADVPRAADRCGGRYQRRTARLATQVGHVVRELAGRAGARVLASLGIGLSRHTAAGAVAAASAGPALALNTVKRYARINQPERLVRAPQYRPTLVDPFRDHLRRRREEDPAVPVLQLLNEITELGYTGSQNLLYRYITQGRVESDRPAISPRRLTRNLLTHPDTLHSHQRERVDAATSACSEMTALAALVRDFAALLTPAPGNDERLNSWIEQARGEDLPHLHAFTRGLDLDRHAVNAALARPFHNGRTEGVNTKTKLIKRQMYGRAGFTLLRHRILLG